MLQDRVDQSSPYTAKGWGVAGAWLGGAAVLSTVYLSLLSTVPDFNPPNWVRILGLIWLPVGFAGSLFTFVFARHGPGRHWGYVGLALTGLAVVGFVVAVNVLG